MYKSFKNMPIWKEAMNIAEQIFTITDNLPRKEDYGFTSQIRRAALSISANIAEAFGRNHTLDKINFYYFARGSLTETQSHLPLPKPVLIPLPLPVFLSAIRNAFNVFKSEIFFSCFGLHAIRNLCSHFFLAQNAFNAFLLDIADFCIILSSV